MWLVAKCWGVLESYIPESELGLHERLPEGQKEKQLGFHDHPVFTYRVAEMLKELPSELGVSTQIL